MSAAVSRAGTRRHRRRAAPPIRLRDSAPAAGRRGRICRPGPSNSPACTLSVPPSAARGGRAFHTVPEAQRATSRARRAAPGGKQNWYMCFRCVLDICLSPADSLLFCAALVRIWVSVDKSRAACRLARVPKCVSLTSYAIDHQSEDEWWLLQQTMENFLCTFSVVATDAVYQQLLNYAIGIFLCSY